jgi:hypothetical protein
MHKYLWLQLAILVLTVGCSGGGGGLYPLGESETWTYQMTTTSGMSNRTAKVTVRNMPKRELAGKIVTPQMTEHNGQTFFSFVGEDPNGFFLLASQVPNAAEPVVMESPQYLLHKPYENGTKWEVATVDEASDTGTPVTLQAAIENVDETVTVPAGTFEGCVKVAAQGESSRGMVREQISWFCPGVGMVKLISKSRNRSTVEESAFQLESHSRGGR